MIKIIAEIGINHNGDLGIAKKLIDIASFSGCDFVKFQKRTPDLCVPEKKKNEIKSTPWGDITYLDYKKRIEFTLTDYVAIDKHCKERGIKWFASAWDIEAAIFLTSFVDIVKIPSAKLTDSGLVDYCRSHFKTLLMSTAMSTEEEINRAVEEGKPDVLFHCEASYPAKPQNLRLEYISWLKDKYPGIAIGYSGHEWGLAQTFAATALGAVWIERHITIDHDMWGSDHKASVDPVGLIKLVKGIRETESSLTGYGERTVNNSELSKRDDLR